MWIRTITTILRNTKKANVPTSEHALKLLFHLYLGIQKVGVYFNFGHFFLFLIYKIREKSFDGELCIKFFCIPLNLKFRSGYRTLGAVL